MNLKASTKYQLYEYKKSLLIYYFVVTVVYASFYVASIISKDSNFETSGGISASTIVFLFIAGLNSFKETFLMSLQNGISRKTFLWGRVISVGVISIIMAVVDRALNGTFGLFNDERYQMVDIYAGVYPTRASEVSSFLAVFESILLLVFMYFAVTACGYLITAAYYRMNKAVKTIVSVGVPTCVFIVIPIIDQFANGRISMAMYTFMRFATGVNKGNPYIIMLSSLVVAFICFGLSWLLTRKAVVKD